jgi:hypothetical protein
LEESLLLHIFPQFNWTSENEKKNIKDLFNSQEINVLLTDSLKQEIKSLTDTDLI